MARVAGRSTWFAWFVGVVCAGIVGALAIMATPMLPAAATWVGDFVRAATAAPLADDDDAVPEASAPSATLGAPSLPADCQALYPAALWELLSTATGVVARVEPEPPALVVASLATTLGAQPALTCGWDAAAGPSIVTSVSRVGAEAPALISTALSAAGFACSPSGVATHCESTAGEVLEVHDVADGVWVVSVLDRWQPPGYASLVASQVWR